MDYLMFSLRYCQERARNKFLQQQLNSEGKQLMEQ